MRDTGTEPVVSSTLRVFLSEDIRHYTTIDAVPFRRKDAWFLYQFKYALFEKSTNANLDREKSIKLSKIKILTSKYCRLTTKHSWISWQRNVITRSKKNRTCKNWVMSGWESFNFSSSSPTRGWKKKSNFVCVRKLWLCFFKINFSYVTEWIFIPILKTNATLCLRFRN